MGPRLAVGRPPSPWCLQQAKEGSAEFLNHAVARGLVKRNIQEAFSLSLTSYLQPRPTKTGLEHITKSLW